MDVKPRRKGSKTKTRLRAVEDGVARMEGEATLDRLAFGIGERSDRSGGWIGRQVRVEVRLVARAE